MRILMVCLGNICRSPMAQGVMEHMVASEQLQWTVDSAGTNGYHDGEAPDPRAIRATQFRGINIESQVSRKISSSDLDDFDIILAMDHSNLSYLLSMCKSEQQTKKIRLLMEFSPTGLSDHIPDPYYDNRFDFALDLIESACTGFIKEFRPNKT